MAYIHDCRQGVVLPKVRPQEFEEPDGWTDQVEDSVDLNSPGLFQTLWILGLFHAINTACGSMVDEYEEEELRPNQLPALRRALKREQRRFRSDDTRSAIDKMLLLASRAESTGRSLHFVL